MDVVLVEGFRHPASRTILVGPPKEPVQDRPWCELPPWPDLPEAARQALLGGLAERLAGAAQEGG